MQVFLLFRALLLQPWMPIMRVLLSSSFLLLAMVPFATTKAAPHLASATGHHRAAVVAAGHGERAAEVKGPSSSAK
jgi:hypothetical protein